MASSARPHTDRAPHLRCETCSRGRGDPGVRRPPGPRRSTRRARRTARRPRCACASRTARRAGSAAVTRAAISSGRGVQPGRVDQPGRQPERAGVDGRVDLADHRAPLQSSARPHLRPDDGAADRAVPDEERDVRPERDLVDGVEVLGERPPARDELIRPQRQLDELASAVGDRGERVATVARQLGREALARGG